jgi:O-antigen/teichoic acid export membrane protein
LKQFEESKYKFEWNKRIIYPMLSFSGLDLYGNLSLMARTQGVNILLNMFFGPLLNAANSVAVQVQSTVLAFANNIITAVRPQIIKSYANGDYQYMIKLILNATKYIYLLLVMLSLPLILEMDFVLHLWLKNVPAFAVSFCRLTLIFNFFATGMVIITSAIYATGHIKRPNLINGSLYLLVIPISYIAFKFNEIPEIPYICNILLIIVGSMVHIYTLKLHVSEFPIKTFVLKVLSICFIITLLAFAGSYYVKSNMSEGLLRFCVVALLSTTLIAGMTYISIDKQTKQKVWQKIKYQIKKWKN